MKSRLQIFLYSFTLLLATNLFAHHHDGGAVEPCYSDSCCYGNICPLCCDNWSFTSEVLFLKPCEDGLAYGTQVNVDTNANPDRIKARIKKPHFKWDIGFRLGLNYQFDCSCWGLGFYWTYFNTHTHSKHTLSRTDTSFFVPGYAAVQFGSILGPSPITEARTGWKKNIDLFDLEFGRDFCLEHCLTIRPHIGLRGAWIQNHYRVRYFAPFEGAVEDVQSLRLRTDYEAVGVRGGLDSQWDLGSGVSLYGKAAISALAGFYDVRSRLRNVTVTPEPDENQVFNVQHADHKDHFCACRAITDLALGLRWTICFCNDALIWTINAGWEQHHFVNLNEFEDLIKNPQFHRGDFCLRGFTLGTNVDF